ncbi:MAG: sigma-70 family RNA polymerase sigma factor [Bacteroidales bacterium]
MSHVIDGEIDKMGILYERYKMPVYAYFFKTTCGDREASEDLVQTVFYRAIKYKNTFTGQGSFANWLFRIARNAGLDHNTKRKKYSDSYDTDIRTVRSAMTDEDENEKRDQIAILSFAMRKLEYEDREIIILGKIECLRYREIAEILGTTEGNIKIRMFRAVRKLKDIFTKIENVRYEKER